MQKSRREAAFLWWPSGVPAVAEFNTIALALRTVRVTWHAT
jgi:hypothetical protein